MKVSYYIGVHTGQNYSPEMYNEKAGTLLNIVMDVLNVEGQVSNIIKGPVASVHTEMDVCLEQYDAGDWQLGEGGWELTLKAVVDIQGTGKMSLDKGKLSTALRAHPLNEWGQSLKIEKKAVPKEMVQIAEAESKEEDQ